MTTEQLIALEIVALIFGIFIGGLIMLAAWNRDLERRKDLTDYRESPCNECATGEMKYTGMTPLYSETLSHYTCDRCGITETYP